MPKLILHIYNQFWFF